MNLRNFHLFFVTLSTLLAVFLAVWALNRYLVDDTAADGAIGILSAVAAVGLVAYGVAFRRKSRYW